MRYFLNFLIFASACLSSIEDPRIFERDSNFFNTTKIAKDEILYTGSCGDSLTYTIYSESGNVTITGSGLMNSYNSRESPFSMNKQYVIHVFIESGVTSIGQMSFYECENLQTIEIPNSVELIEEYSFFGCNSLTSITIPDSVETIGNYWKLLETILSAIAVLLLQLIYKTKLHQLPTIPFIIVILLLQLTFQTILN